jgi:hypothetical protein
LRRGKAERIDAVKTCVDGHGGADPAVQKVCDADPNVEWIPIGESISNSTACGLDANGHIVVDGKGG